MNKEMEKKFEKMYLDSCRNYSKEPVLVCRAFIDEHFIEIKDMEGILCRAVENTQFPDLYTYEQVLELIGEDKEAEFVSDMDNFCGYNLAKQEIRDKVNLTSKKK